MPPRTRSGQSQKLIDKVKSYATPIGNDIRNAVSGFGQGANAVVRSLPPVMDYQALKAAGQGVSRAFQGRNPR